MNRKWPRIAAWTLACVTAGTVPLLGFVSLGLYHQLLFWLAAGATVLAILSQRLHLQHSLTAGIVVLLTISVFYAVFATGQDTRPPSASSKGLYPDVPYLSRAFDLSQFFAALQLSVIVGICRVAALRLIPSEYKHRGLWLLVVSVFVLYATRLFCLGIKPLLKPVLALFLEKAISLVIPQLDWWIVMLAAVISQIIAAPWLVKTIPKAAEDTRPAIVLWLALVLWLLAGAAR